MKRIPVKSSNLASVGYDEQTLTLEVEFLRDGSIYQYYPVSNDIYIELMKADSKGTYFSKHIRDNRMYMYKKLPPELKWPRQSLMRQ